MNDHPIIIFTALLVLGYGLFSKGLERAGISAPIVFVSVGILVSVLIGDDWKEGITARFVEPIAELTLILVLFLDASTLNLRALMKDRQLPMRLLFIGLPITMVAGVALAIPLFPEVDLWPLIMMAIVLSPTDAALGLAVVTSQSVPLRIRQTINVESGLNDGIAFPPFLICLAILSGASTEESGFSYWSFFVLKQIIFGPLIGGLVGWLGGYLVEITSTRGWMNNTFQRLASISIALLAYSVAEAIDGNGFIAAFFAGMLLGTRVKEIRSRLHEFGEAESQALILFIFLLLGMILVPFSFPFWDTRTVIYALLSLTVIRMIPVAMSLLGTDLSWGKIMFIGWFGPRGIGSVLYFIMFVIKLGRNGYEQIIAVITLTILLSIFLHGITAVPFSRLFERKS